LLSLLAGGAGDVGDVDDVVGGVAGVGVGDGDGVMVVVVVVVAPLLFKLDGPQQHGYTSYNALADFNKAKIFVCSPQPVYARKSFFPIPYSDMLHVIRLRMTCCNDASSRILSLACRRFDDIIDDIMWFVSAGAIGR
jgi:hypothetical protein